MAEYKICPSCGFKNPLSENFCQNVGCSDYLFGAETISEPEEKEMNKEEITSSSKFAQLFSSSPSSKPVSSDKKKVVKQINVKENVHGDNNAVLNVKNEKEFQKKVPKFIITKDSRLKIEPDSTKKLIGRGGREGNEIEAYLSNKLYVSRKHLRIWKTETGIYVCDIGSKNGTYINEKKLKPNEEYTLNVGDVLVLGKPSKEEANIAIFNVE